ncbi:MATE family efflux transporter [Wukongibacter baidiensis]|uniref:MATE family efflux transporter n=1 Tax=Wukongibacter baidiensis TaxID=1723361 RepID=UPI003D7FE2E8
MNNSLDLRNDKISKLFLNYFIPTVAGMLVMALHVVIDGIFVGRGIGSNGLAAVNIVVPVFTVFTGIGLLIGLGGATIVSIKLAQGKEDEASSIFTQSMVLSVVIMLTITILGLLNIEKLSYALGANDEILPLVVDYMRIVLYFSIIFTLGNAINCFIRNDGAPKLAMFCMILGGVINFILDYLFIFKFHWGVKGAAIATGAGNLIGLIILLMYFLRQKGKLRFVKTRFYKKDIIRIFENGLPTFLAEICISVVTIVHNLILMKMLGETGVSAYSIINYIHPLMLMIFMGTAQAVQPIISYNYGANEEKRVDETLKLTVKMSVILGIGFCLSGLLFSKQMVMLFLKNNPEVIQIASSGIRIFFLNYLFMGCNMVIAIYFQAIEHSKLSTIITLCRGLIFIILGLLILPKFSGINGVWLATPIAEFLTIVVSAFFLKYYKEQVGLEIYKNVNAKI